MEAIQTLFGLQGSVAIVTGASGGLGVEFADALASAGADVALLARRDERVAAEAAAIAARHGNRAVGIGVDITDREALVAAFERVDRELGPVDILVNNAGIAPTGRASKQWPEAWDTSLDVNMSALFQASLLAHERMAPRGAGRIINITSIFARGGSPIFRVAAYAATKAGAENLTRQLAVEWAEDGVTVNAIAPAWFSSEMTEASLEKQGIAEKMSGNTPMQRIGKPGELRTAVLFLAAPASSYVTGAIIPVDGGWTAW
ncbi:MAG: NAD(P)-dependent dehydrogenase (short-subunit alcohol dehydrogenase family) [Hyphomicrobiaceae bacterium]|jgi:NAD(P)-dependent dehydrogenase (short-subunit alcohol dehydrogenase family)